MFDVTRRSFLAALPASSLLLRNALAAPASTEQLVYIGTTGNKSEGIYTAVFNSTNGSLSAPKLAIKAAAPSYLALTKTRDGKRYMYATSDVGAPIPTGRGPGGAAPTAATPAPPASPTPAAPAMISTFAVEGESVRFINKQDALGGGPTVASMAANDRVLLVANYWGGNFTTYTTGTDGALSPPVTHVQFRNEDGGPLPNQRQARAHSIYPSPDGAHVFVCDFSGDKVRIYNLNAKTAELTPGNPEAWVAPPGTTPRHMVFHPNGKWIYCIGESDAGVDLLLWDSKAATLTHAGTRAMTVPAGKAPTTVRCADIILSPDARFVYASNRGAESFAVLAVGKDGTLTQVQVIDNPGKENRSIAIDRSGRWFLAANLRTDDVTVMPRDTATGKLLPQYNNATVPGAAFVVFA